MPKTALLVASFLLLTGLVPGLARAQQEPKPEPAQQQGQPPVKVTYLNVCTPSSEEQAVLKSALAKTTARAPFVEDFEITRGRATVKDAPASKFVRLRRDVAPESPLLTVQYSMSKDEKSTVETLVLRMRDPKEFHEISIEDRVSADAASALSVLATDTPATRIRVERIGKSSVVVARCQNVDQSGYEPLFRQASEIMAQYRKTMGLRTMFRADINWLDSKPAHKPPANGGQKKR